MNYHPKLMFVAMFFFSFTSIASSKKLTCETVLAMTEELERDGYSASDPSMQEALLKVAKFAEEDVTVLITGETGTGKEVIANLLHLYNKKRKERHFVVVDGTTVQGDTAISELFGHEIGAFTGAVKRSAGLMASASGGTVFIDEAADLTPQVQGMLLRFANEEADKRMIRAVGSDAHRTVNVRLVIATNRDLGELVAAGKFRSDLYYRLNVARIDLKPLRDRPNEILPIAQKLLQKYSHKYRRSLTKFSDSAQLGLRSYSWPGNIRQLAGVIERSVLLSESEKETLDKKDLNFDDEKFFSSKVSVLDLAGKPGTDRLLEKITAIAYRDAYIRGNRMQNAAAEILGMSARSFNYWWNKDRAEFPDLFPVEIFGPLPTGEVEPEVELKRAG